jgi:hypothetical protein
VPSEHFPPQQIAPALQVHLQHQQSSQAPHQGRCRPSLARRLDARPITAQSLGTIVSTSRRVTGSTPQLSLLGIRPWASLVTYRLATIIVLRVDLAIEVEPSNASSFTWAIKASLT